LTVVAFALVGWALCFATIGAAMATTSKDNALMIHALAAPVFFVILSAVYFSRFGHTSPLATALALVGIVIAMDFFVVALVFLRSLDMFTSLIGTWIPFASIFAATYLTGTYMAGRRRSAGPDASVTAQAG
jgi:hypothetical protein